MAAAVSFVLLALPFFFQRKEITKSAKNLTVYIVFAVVAFSLSLIYTLNPYGDSIYGLIMKLVK